MGAIEVSCANQECDSEDVDIIASEDVEISVLEIKMLGTRHRCSCNFCNYEFLFYTCFDVQIPQEVITHG